MAAGSTYTPIATTTLSSAQATISFTSISSGYTDLICIINMTRSASGNNLSLRLNSDTGTNYSSTYLEADGSSTYSGRGSNEAAMRIAAIAGGFGTDQSTIIINLQNYSNATTYKTVLTRYSEASTIVGCSIGLWRNTSAITSIDFSAYGSSTNFLTGTVATLYGIKAA